MKTGHSRVAVTIGVFPSVSGGTMWDLCVAREPNVWEGAGGNFNRGSNARWMTGTGFKKAGGKAAVTYHLKSSYGRRERGREPVLGSLEIIASHFSWEKREKKRVGFTWRCYRSNACAGMFWDQTHKCDASDVMMNTEFPPNFEAPMQNMFLVLVLFWHPRSPHQPLDKACFNLSIMFEWLKAGTQSKHLIGDH